MINNCRQINEGRRMDGVGDKNQIIKGGKVNFFFSFHRKAFQYNIFFLSKKKYNIFLFILKAHKIVMLIIPFKNVTSIISQTSNII
jgi:hypothetical protein